MPPGLAIPQIKNIFNQNNLYAHAEERVKENARVYVQNKTYINNRTCGRSDAVNKLSKFMTTRPRWEVNKLSYLLKNFLLVGARNFPRD